MTKPNLSVVSPSKSITSYKKTRYNAVKHGALSRLPVLPWENAEELEHLQQELLAEYTPQGASEEHLVLEMANCIFRKQRIYRAENALIMKRMSQTSSYDLKYTLTKAANLFVPDIHIEKELELKPIIHHSDEDADDQAESLAEHKKYLEDVQGVIDTDLSYEAMLEQCPQAAVDLWKSWVSDEEGGYKPNKKSFKQFLEKEVIEWCKENIPSFQARPYLKQQIIGLSYNPDKDTDHLQRHETTLDRRFEKALAMLLKLQEVRAMKPSVCATSIDSVL